MRVSLEPHAEGLTHRGQEDGGLGSAGTGAMWQTTQDPVRVPCQVIMDTVMSSPKEATAL